MCMTGPTGLTEGQNIQGQQRQKGTMADQMQAGLKRYLVLVTDPPPPSSAHQKNGQPFWTPTHP